MQQEGNAENKDLYEDILRMACMVDIMYANYEEKMVREEREKEIAEAYVTSTPSSEQSYSSSYSHHSEEEINLSLQVENVELRRLLREEKEEKQILQL